MTRRQKKYRPRQAKSGMHVLIAASVAKEPMTDEDARELEIVPYTALDAVTRGHGTSREWDSLANVLNQGWTLACNGIGSEAKPVFERAHQGMRRAVPRYRRLGIVGLDGDALRDIREAIDLWCQQIRMCTVGEVAASAQLVEREYHKHQEAA